MAVSNVFFIFFTFFILILTFLLNFSDNPSSIQLPENLLLQTNLNAWNYF